MKLIRSTIDLESRVQIMGVLNVTPDSFSDGGRYLDIDRAVERAWEMLRQGADILDIGGESTRPRSKPVSVDEEMSRVAPVLDRLAGELPIPISIDTTKSEVARRAIAAGAEIINDVSGLRHNLELAEIAADSGAALLLMHSRGTPENMQQLPPVEDILSEVTNGLHESIQKASELGVTKDRLILDPGIGFGKTPEQNLLLINRVDRLIEEFRLPVLIGPSRKSFIDRTFEAERVGVEPDREIERVFGTAVSVVIGIERGARIVRVHDVKEMAAVVRLTEVMLGTQKNG